MAARVAGVVLVLAAVTQLAAVLRAVTSDDPPPANALGLAAFVGLLALLSAAVLLIRVGYWHKRMPFELGRTGARWVAYAALGGAVAGFAGQMDAAWYLAGPVNLVISLLATAVARSDPPRDVAPRASIAASTGRAGVPR